MLTCGKSSWQYVHGGTNTGPPVREVVGNLCGKELATYAGRRWLPVHEGRWLPVVEAAGNMCGEVVGYLC
jgi:hypothetical protein